MRGGMRLGCEPWFGSRGMFSEQAELDFSRAQTPPAALCLCHTSRTRALFTSAPSRHDLRVRAVTDELNVKLHMLMVSFDERNGRSLEGRGGMPQCVLRGDGKVNAEAPWRRGTWHGRTRRAIDDVAPLSTRRGPPLRFLMSTPQTARRCQAPAEGPCLPCRFFRLFAI